VASVSVVGLRSQIKEILRVLASQGLERGRDHVAAIGLIGWRDPRAAKFRAFGSGSALMWPTGVRYNEHAISIGEDTLIGPNVVLSAGMAPGQELLSDRIIEIGSRTLIGRGSHIVGHWHIEIGDDIQTGPNVYITDQNHGYQDLDRPIGAQDPIEAAVKIGSGSWLGANVVVLPGSDIGEHCVVAAGAVVRGVFPDRVVIAGVPAKVVRRYVAGEGWGAP